MEIPIENLKMQAIYMKNSIYQKDNRKLYVFLAFYSFILMLFFSETSPLFAINEWVDPNAFFTVGKGMANGLVPYRDLFEQKGPLLYGLHAFAYMISHTTFFGVYIIESLALLVNLLLAFKISRIYLNWMPSAIISIFLPLLLLIESSFRYGDSAEEFCIPFFMALLYFILKNYKDGSDFLFKWPVYLVNGILIGCVFWIKYTLTGAWIGFYLAILFIAIINRRWRDLGNAFIFTFSGLLLSSIPWLIYFGMNHAIKDLLDVYIKFNMFTYSSHSSLFEKFLLLLFVFGLALKNNPLSAIFISIGFIFFTRRYFKDAGQKWIFISTAIFLIIGVYIGGRGYPYYFLIITPLGLLGLIVLGSCQRLALGQNNRWTALSIGALVTILLCFVFNANIESSQLFHKEPFAQQTFAKIINREPHPTLLNYNSLDGGFYLAANIVPNVRYFERQNIDYRIYHENMDEQNRYIREKKVQFVVIKVPVNTRTSQLHIPYLKQNYHLVSQQKQKVEGKPFKYLLYKRGDGSRVSTKMGRFSWFSA